MWRISRKFYNWSIWGQGPILEPISCDRGIVIEEYLNPLVETHGWSGRRTSFTRKGRGTRQIVSQLSFTGEAYMHNVQTVTFSVYQTCPWPVLWKPHISWGTDGMLTIALSKFINFKPRWHPPVIYVQKWFPKPLCSGCTIEKLFLFPQKQCFHSESYWWSPWFGFQTHSNFINQINITSWDVPIKLAHKLLTNNCFMWS